MTDAPQNNGELDQKKVWQNQTSEVTAMTVEMVRRRAQELHAKTRRLLAGNIATVFLVIAVSIFGFAHTRNPGFRLAFILSIVWAAVGQFLLHRGVWSAPPPERWALMTGLEFYRREIERRRNVLGRLLQWSFGPMILNLGILVLLLTGMAQAIGKADAALPFSTLCVVWVIAVFVFRSRDQRELRKENEQLNRMENMPK